MILLQKVLPLACELGWHAAQHRREGNQESHMPLSSKERPWLDTVRQNSRLASYSLLDTRRLTRR
jgi:hypothetical protein